MIRHAAAAHLRAMDWRWARSSASRAASRRPRSSPCSSGRPASAARHESIVYALPVAGLVHRLALRALGQARSRAATTSSSTRSTRTAPQIPLRMAPMVLVGTVLTHLFGGSAGREGTAVQMGASLADAIAHRFRVGRETRRAAARRRHRGRLRLGVRHADRRRHLRARGRLPSGASSTTRSCRRSSRRSSAIS